MFHPGGLPVGGGSDLGLRHRLRVPASLSESDRERVRGLCSGQGAEVDWVHLGWATDLT